VCSRRAGRTCKGKWERAYAQVERRKGVVACGGQAWARPSQMQKNRPKWSLDERLGFVHLKMDGPSSPKLFLFKINYIRDLMVYVCLKLIWTAHMGGLIYRFRIYH
jgi:hypothetical protein